MGETTLFGRRVIFAFGGTALAGTAFAADFSEADVVAAEEEEFVVPVLLLASGAAEAGLSNTERRDGRRCRLERDLPANDLRARVLAPAERVVRGESRPTD